MVDANDLRKVVWPVCPAISVIPRERGQTDGASTFFAMSSPKNVPGETLSGLAKRGLRRQASLGERLKILMSAELVRLHPPLRV